MKRTEGHPRTWGRYVESSFLALALTGLYLVSRYNYPFFRTLSELFGVSISFGIFAIAWNSRRFISDTYLLFIGIAYFFVGAIDLLHALSSHGIALFSGHNGAATLQLWIAGRFVQSVSFLIAPVFIGERLNAGAVLAAYALASGLLLFSIVSPGLFPAVLAEGAKGALLVTVSEYLIAAVLLAGLVLLIRKRRHFDPAVFKLLASAIILITASELALTSMVETAAFSNVAGHLVRLMSFYLVYRTVIITGLIRPHDLLFRNLKQSEADLNELNRELETTVAERTMSLMALSIADRVRNPATIIGSISRRILAREKVPARLAKDIGDIIFEVERLESVVRDFESLLRLRQSSYRYEDLNGIVRMVLPALEREAAEKGVALIIDLSRRPLRINAQRNLLRAAIFHVIKNAVDATLQGGRITIASSGTHDAVVLSITDTGSGIPPEDRDRVFDPFFSTKRYRFGLGLALVRQIMAEHLGDITLESEVGKGTTVRLVFPTRWLVPFTAQGRRPS
ncbi:MAG: MASE3 domain-containing protein [Nitrospirota bacterium]